MANQTNADVLFELIEQLPKKVQRVPAISGSRRGPTLALGATPSAGTSAVAAGAAARTPLKPGAVAAMGGVAVGAMVAGWALAL